MTITQLNGTEPNTNGSSHKKPQIPRHRMRNMLEDGTPVIGCFQSLTGSWAARIVASCGWDYVIVDCEHGNHDDSSMHDAVNAIAAEGVSPIVRIRGQDGGLIKRALDAGSHGVMIPMVNSADQARQIVQWSKFPPMGARGQGSSFCAMASGISVDQYLRCANQTILTFVQIETPEAVANAESIAAVPGVDGLFIGPNDLALAMLGYVPATWQEPEFVAALDAVHSACRKHGKYAGVLSKNAKHAKELMKTFDVVGAGSDVKTLTTAMRATLESIRGD